MSVNSFDDLMRHWGHDVKVVRYRHNGETGNVAIECETCQEVLVDYDRPGIQNDRAPCMYPGCIRSAGHSGEHRY